MIGDIPEEDHPTEPSGTELPIGGAGEDRDLPQWETHARRLVRDGGHGGYGAATMTIDSPPAGGGAIATYVSLFLILFVFFIVLFSSARVQRDRVNAVLASLDSAFGHIPSNLGILPNADAPARADEGFARDLGQMLGQFGALGVSAVPGADGLLSVDVPVDRLFAAGSTDMVAAASPLLDRLAVMLQQSHASGGEPGRRYRLIWRVAVPSSAPDAKTPDATLSETGAAASLELARGASFAAALFARGCPGDGIAITREAAASSAAAGLRWVFVDLGAEASEGRHPALGGTAP